MAKAFDPRQIADQVADLIKNRTRSGEAVNPTPKTYGQHNPIGGVGGMMGKGLYGTYKNTKSGQDIWTAAKNAHTNKDNKLNYGAVAGSFIAAGAAYRVASGGGAYRDANGNTDVIGVPFI